MGKIQTAFTRRSRRRNPRRAGANGLLLVEIDAGISRLSEKERFDLVGELWDGLAAEEVWLTPLRSASLRIATFDDDAKTAIPWESRDREFVRRKR